MERTCEFQILYLWWNISSWLIPIFVKFHPIGKDLTLPLLISILVPGIVTFLVFHPPRICPSPGLPISPTQSTPAGTPFKQLLSLCWNTHFYPKPRWSRTNLGRLVLLHWIQIHLQLWDLNPLPPWWHYHQHLPFQTQVQLLPQALELALAPALVQALVHLLLAEQVLS